MHFPGAVAGPLDRERKAALQSIPVDGYPLRIAPHGLGEGF
jgi:hypothetical protein